MLLTCVKNEDVINDSLLAIALSATENDEVLAELSAGMAIPSRGWLASWHIRVDLKKGYKQKVVRGE